jgi:predicted membrane channel-forming protein YqfA (hemolysin III family)
MYIAMISIFGGATIVAVTKPIFRTPQYRWIRSCLFLAMGLSAVFPVVHGLVLYGVRVHLHFPHEHLRNPLRYAVWKHVLTYLLFNFHFKK